MATKYLATYLNDHLAGSVVALEMLEHLEERHAGSDLGSFFSKLQADVAADRQELENLMSRLEIAESRPRKAIAWISENITELKLKADDPAGESLRLLESLDVLCVGIEGKRRLWRALSAAAEVTPKLRGPDYEHLQSRAKEQRERVEVVRLDAARKALGED